MNHVATTAPVRRHHATAPDVAPDVAPDDAPSMAPALQADLTSDATAGTARPSALAATVLASAALQACGGGADAAAADTHSLPQALANGTISNNSTNSAGGTDGPARRRLLGAPAATPSGAAPAPVPTATQLMDWAEKAYVSFFPTHEADRSAPPYVYRYYPATGNYLGVANGRVYVLGPAVGSTTTAVDVGALSDFAERVQVTRFPADDAQAARFLGQATLGVTEADIAAARSQGYDAWLTAEMARPVSTSNWQFLLDKGIADNLDNRNSAIGTDPAIWQRLITAPDSLRQRVALALSEIFVVGFDGLTGPWKQFKLAAWWDLLADNAFGNYRTLIEKVTLNAAMGQYLSSAGNQKENTSTGRLPDENYAREVMQLFSIGLLELNSDGTPRLDTQGRPIETYTQDTVSQLARVFTGWNVAVDPFSRGPGVMRLPMVLTDSQHSTLAVNALGMAIPAGTSGTSALKMTLDTLAAHPNTGPFIGRQLIQRLVTSNPSAAYVSRVAARWADNGAGVRGDLGAVVRAILTDEEARDPARAASPSFGKLREPMLRFVQWARSFKATTISGDWTVGDLTDASSRLGQSPLRAPSVFNWFRPGYVPAGTALAQAALVAPEFQGANENSVAGYLNFMQNVIPGGRNDLRPDYTAELALVANPAALVDRVQLLLCAQGLSSGTRSTIVNAVTAMPASSDANKLARVHATLLLVMASPDYLVQK